LSYSDLGIPNTQTHSSASGWVSESNNNNNNEVDLFELLDCEQQASDTNKACNWESLLDETTDDDASAIDDVSQILDELQEEQEQQLTTTTATTTTTSTTTTTTLRMPTIPDISNIKRHISTIPAIPTVMIPTMLNSSKFVMPKIPVIPISIPTYAVHVMPSSVPKVDASDTTPTTTLTRKQRVKRWQAKRHRRNWGKKNVKNEYYGLRKDTAAKRRRRGGKFSGSNVSWVSCS